MTEDSDEVEVEEVETEEVETDESEQGEQPDPEMESRARRLGWAPKDDFRGNPDLWVDAATFVQRGEEVMPILKATNRKLEGKIGELEQTLKDFADHHTKTQQRMYQKAIRDLKVEQRKAAEEGDVSRFDQIEQQVQDVVKDATSGKPNGAATDQQAKVDPVAKEWAQDNRWFREDPELGNFAATYHETLLKTKPGLTLEENLQEVTKATKRAYPEKFSNPKRNGAQTVEGNPGPKSKGGKGYSDLPAEAKAACDRFVKQGLMKKEDYVKDYFTE